MFCAASDKTGELARGGLCVYMIHYSCVNRYWDSVCYVVTVSLLFHNDLLVWKEGEGRDIPSRFLVKVMTLEFSSTIHNRIVKEPDILAETNNDVM
jgi:hypothetical protein